MTAKLLPREEGQRRYARREAEQEAAALIVSLSHRLRASSLWFADLPGAKHPSSYSALEEEVIALAARLRESASGGEAIE